MGVEWIEIGVKVRKVVIFTVRGCFKSVCNHPFLVGVLCFLIFLYRLSPFIFQLLVSASPILVCTAVLLGTLLSFGQPNIPEIEVEEETRFEAVPIKTGVLGETTIVEKNESFYVERFSESRWDEGKESTERPDLLDGKLGEGRRDDSDDPAPLIEERSPGAEVNEGEIWEGSRELGDLGYELKTDWIEERLNNGEVVENHYASVKADDDLLDSDDEKSEADSFDSEKVNVDTLDSPPPSPWTRVQERGNEEEEEGGDDDGDDDDDDDDSGSEGAESSSPDASMADIMPMLDELHPLLDDEAPQTVQRSGASCHESDDESENHEDLEVADDDNEDGEDEEDGHGDKEERTKCAITWTEEDQKNLMDLGSSEIERNQRLENLILRRRARKMFADRNLIDLESCDLPLNIAPISTKRQNPFDLAHEYYDNSGLPPIPGSAPSVMSQRRNPFDIPYDSSEEKPDLMADGFQEEFKTSQSREPVFRRHESFNIGPSHFAPKRQDVKMRPYFVPEGSISEASTSSLFQRQSSELSESKMSSVPDTESIGSVTSVEDPEDRKLSEEDNLPEVEVIEQAQVDTEDVHDEPETISKLESVSDHVGHGSQSSDEEDSLELGQVENKDDEVGEIESQMEDIADHYEHRHSRDSSSSSLSEVSERVFTVTEGEGLSMLEARIDDVAEEPIIFAQTSAQITDLDITSMPVNDILHREPVYDTSPRALSKNVSSSSISSYVHPESALGSLPVMDERTVSSTRREFETEIPSSVEMLHDPSQNLERLQKDNYFLLSKDSLLEVNEPPFEGQLSAEHSVSMEEIVQSPKSKADVDDHHEDDEKFISTLSFEGNMSLLHDKAIHEPNFTHLNELQASSSAPVESFVDGQVAQNLNMPEVRELDHYISSNVNSPSSPEIISFPPSVVESTTSHVDVQTTVEEVDEIKEIDDALLSELDNVGDFSIQQLGSGSSEFEKHINSVEEERFSSLHHAQISTMRDVELHSAVVNMTEDALHLESSREHIGVYEEDVECISELQPSETSRAENVETSKMEFPYQETSGEEILSRESEVQSGQSLVNHNEDAFSIIPELEVRSLEDVNVVPFEKAELTSEGIETSSGMPELEASTAEDIDLAFKQILSSEIEKPVGLEPAQAELRNDEDSVSEISESEVQSIEDVDAVPRKSELASVETETMVEGAEFSSHDQVDMGISSAMPELEASTIDDIDLTFKQITCGEIKKPVVLEPAQAELHDGEDTIHGLRESDVQTIEDVDAIPKKAELTSVETDVMVRSAEVSYQAQVHMDTTSGMPELDASSVEDIDMEFKQISAKEYEKPATLELPQKELHDYEDTVPEKPELKEQSIEDVDDVKSEIIVGGQVVTDTTSGITELEASTVEDIDQAIKQIAAKEIKKSVVLEPTEAEVVVGESATENTEDQRDSSVSTYTHETSVLEVGPIEDANLDYNQSSTEGITGSHGLDDSVDHTLHVVESGETHSASSELHVAESIPPNQALDGETQKQLKLNSDDGSVEVKAGKESSAYAAEKPEHEDKAPEDLQSKPSSVKGKGKSSKNSNSSSSSSSSSESSSSDSDGE